MQRDSLVVLPVRSGLSLSLVVGTGENTLGLVLVKHWKARVTCVSTLGFAEALKLEVFLTVFAEARKVVKADGSFENAEDLKRKGFSTVGREVN